MLDRMVEHARREAPNECVGVLGTRDGEPELLVEAENARHSPLAYEIAPQELLRVHERQPTVGAEALIEAVRGRARRADEHLAHSATSNGACVTSPSTIRNARTSASAPASPMMR